jgi:hypothetical protein
VLATDAFLPQSPSTSQAKNKGSPFIPVDDLSNSAPQLPAQRPPHADDVLHTPNTSRKRQGSPSAQTPHASNQPAPKPLNSKTPSAKRIRGVLVKWMEPESIKGGISASAPKLQRVLTFGEDKIIHGHVMSQAFCAGTNTKQPPHVPAQNLPAEHKANSPR